MKRQPLSFDALEIGMQGRSGGRTMNDADLSFSCMLSGGWHPIHADADVRITALRVSRDPGRGVLEREIRLIRHNDEVVQHGVSILLARRHGEAA